MLALLIVTVVVFAVGVVVSVTADLWRTPVIGWFAFREIGKRYEPSQVLSQVNRQKLNHSTFGGVNKIEINDKWVVMLVRDDYKSVGIPEFILVILAWVNWFNRFVFFGGMSDNDVYATTARIAERGLNKVAPKGIPVDWAKKA